MVKGQEGVGKFLYIIYYLYIFVLSCDLTSSKVDTVTRLRPRWTMVDHVTGLRPRWTMVDHVTGLRPRWTMVDNVTGLYLK